MHFDIYGNYVLASYGVMAAIFSINMGFVWWEKRKVRNLIKNYSEEE